MKLRRHSHSGRALPIVLTMMATAAEAQSAQSAVNPLGLKAHHITALVVDIDRATNWYRNVLGFEIVDQGIRDNGYLRYAELKIPGFGLGLVQTQEAAVTVPAGTVVKPSWLHMVFSVANADTIYRTLKQRGVPVSVWSKTDTKPVSSFRLADSEGNELRIVTAP